MLAIEGVSAGYGRLEILHKVSLEVAPGEIVGIIGPNGAGKSTLLKTIFGYLPPFEGSIRFADETLGEHAAKPGNERVLRIRVASDMYPIMQNSWHDDSLKTLKKGIKSGSGDDVVVGPNHELCVVTTASAVPMREE